MRSLTESSQSPWSPHRLLIDPHRVHGDSMETPWGLREESVRTLWGLCEDFMRLCEDFMRTLWGLCGDSVRTLWGLYEDSVRTLWGLCEDSVGTLWGLYEDSVRTPWGLHEDCEDSMRTLWGLWYIWYNLPCRSVIVSTSVLAHFFAASTWLRCYYIFKYILHLARVIYLQTSYHTYMVAYIYSSSLQCQYLPHPDHPPCCLSPLLIHHLLCVNIQHCM